MRMMSIASGSSGNCIYIGTDNAHILVDDGISRKKVLEGLAKLDLKADDIDAILVTHEHDDHIKGLGVLERHSITPIYATGGTLKGISGYKNIGAMPEGIYHSIEAGSQFNIKDISVKAVHISHDAADPVAYVFESGSKKAGIATDLGTYDEGIISNFNNLDTVMIEANHDINMLMTGPYPYPLKQRILGLRGHLSNEACGRLLGELISDRTEHIVLGHLSHENNFPDLAYETVRMEINLGDNAFKAEDFDIQVARRDVPSDIITI